MKISRTARVLSSAHGGIVADQRTQWAPTQATPSVTVHQASPDALPVGMRQSVQLSTAADGEHGSAGSYNSEQGSRAIPGELILDGAELGSWVVRHLSDSLAAAPIGTTGPDGRIAPPTLGTALYPS